MKIPRDLSGAELVKRLARLGYATTRQTGSHIRLTSTVQGEHHKLFMQPQPFAYQAKRSNPEC